MDGRFMVFAFYRKPCYITYMPKQSKYRNREDGTRLCGACRELKPLELFCTSDDKKRSYQGLHKVCDDCKTKIQTRVGENGRMCTACREYKQWSEFSVDNKNIYGRSTKCKSCRAKYHRNRYVKATYGLDQNTYQLMYDEQKGVCPICLEWFPLLNIDHCHTMGTVRGLLCNLCNIGLGGMRDSTDNMRRAIKYLGG